MIAYIKGELSDINEDGIVVENNNIGYEIRVPMSMISQLSGIGNEVKIYTYMYVREDALNLYGFLTKDDLNIFKLLITVNGIGPKGALGILSSISADDLRFAVLANDTKTISKAPGIGAKTAGKLILELKDKLKLEEAFEKKFENQGNSSNASMLTDARHDAIEALVALGYASTDAMKAVRKVSGDNLSTEEILKLSLKNISF